MYALNNMHTLWINSPELENYDKIRCLADFRFQCIKVWYAISKKFTRRPAVLHYPVKASCRKRQLQDALMSPRKGTKISLLITVLLKYYFLQTTQQESSDLPPVSLIKDYDSKNTQEQHGTCY